MRSMRCSLANNNLCARGNMEGLQALCEAVKTNTSLLNLK